MDERVFAVVRSRSDRIDAAIVAAALGGGGHAQAASAIARGSLDEARHLVLEALARAEPEAQRARDVMSTPARVVTPDESVREAMVLCQRHGQSGVFVAENGRVVGAVSREDLDKAIGHDLAHAPVRGIMSGSVATVSEQATLAELQSLVTTAADGRVAVVRDDELVGVVTRADLLRALEGVEPEQVEPAESIAAELTGIERLRPVIDAVAALGERPENVFLVGGTVRDILLGEESFDVDIAVEGDAIAFAGALAGALGGRMTPHQKFGTAVVQYEGGRVDVVTTRTEFYDAPGALPTVERAGLREDLFRRDFTVNAMAASLKAADFGRLEDPFRGRDDLDARVLRVLHNLSFIDDPTRIFRAIRYEARYGLQLEEHSARLARGTIEMGLVGDLSSARLRDELIALLEDPGAAGAILRLGELGADRAIHPHLRADAEAATLFERALSLRAELERRRSRLASRRGGARARHDLGRGLRLARPAQGSPSRGGPDRGRDPRGSAHRRTGTRRAARRGPDSRAGRHVRTRRAAARPGPGRPTRVARVLLAAARRPARDRRPGSRSPRSVRVAPSGGGARGAAAAEAERRDRRTRVRARGGAGVDGGRGLVTIAAAEEIAARYRRIRTEVGDSVTIVAATKYVSLEDMGVLVEAGIDVVGENRAQDLERKHAVYGDAFRWQFIGHLQSNKVKVVNRVCELVHSLSSESAAERIAVPALLEVNLAGESSKSGVAPEDAAAYTSRYPLIRGLMTMPPLASDPEHSRPFFRRLRELAEEIGLAELSMGTSQDYRIAVEEGATLVRIGEILFQGDGNAREGG